MNEGPQSGIAGISGPSLVNSTDEDSWERVGQNESLHAYHGSTFEANAVVVGGGADTFSDDTVRAFPRGSLDSSI